MSRRFANLLLSLLFLTFSACAGGPDPSQPRAPESQASGRGSGGINAPVHRNKPYVVLISFDGFRPDYLDKFDLPNLRRMVQSGVRARALLPVFPSLTFPNHYSLVTGLYPDRHGIVANSFYDPARKQTYSLSDRKAVTDGTWYGGEPIWVTAEQQGMVAAMFFWPGSEAAIKGIRPTYWKDFDATIPNAERVTGVLEWLQLPEERRPHMLALYFNELDSTSHRVPMNAPEIERAAQSLDASLGLLVDGIAKLPIANRVYLVLTSDHGMVETGTDQTVRLDAMLDTGLIQVGFGGPVSTLHVNGNLTVAQQVRNRLNQRLVHGKAYLRSELPKHYRYNNPRAGDVVVVMNESWTLATSPPSPRLTKRWGMHGWDPSIPSMHALFSVSGPSVRAGKTVSDVRNVDVYHFITERLGLAPAPQLDGEPRRVSRIVMR